jgi:chaperonin cofactor prefoldin
MRNNIYQHLILFRMSINALRQQFNQQLDGLEMEITRLIPEEESRGRHKPSLEEMKKIVDKACPSHNNLRTDHRFKNSIPRLKIARK